MFSRYTVALNHCGTSETDFEMLILCHCVPMKAIMINGGL